MVCKLSTKNTTQQNTAQEQYDTDSRPKTKWVEGPTKDFKGVTNGGASIFAFLLFDFTVVLFALLVL